MHPATPPNSTPGVPRPALNEYGSVGASTKKLVDDAIEALPDKVKAALVAHGVEVRLAHSIADAAPDIVHMAPRGWPPGMTFEHCDGCYRDAPRKKLIACENRKRVGDDRLYKVKERRLLGIFHHEAGHAFDEATGYPSKSAAFLMAYQLDESKMDAATRTAVSYYLACSPFLGPVIKQIIDTIVQWATARSGSLR